MRKIEAFLITSLIGICWFPFLVISSVFYFIMEFYFNTKEIFSKTEKFEKALVTKQWKSYFNSLHECYDKIVNED